MIAPRIDRERLRALHQEHVDDLVARYAKVLAAHALDAVVLHTGSVQQKSVFDDQYWPLVVVPHTRHWMPLAVADCAVVVESGMKPRLLVNTERGYWEGPPEPESDHFWSAFDVVEVDGADRIKKLLPSTVGTPRVAFVGEDRKRAASWGFADDQTAPAALLKALDALRTTKTEYERVCLVEANERACRGHAAVLRAFRDAGGADLPSELDLHLLYLKHTQQDDPETPYKNIVALGEHAATLHHVSYGRQRSHAQSLLLDAGATFCGYDSDITRTAVRGTGAAADAFRGIVAGVEKLQQELCARAKPGVPYEQLHNQSHELLAQVLVDVGVAKQGTTANALVESGMTRKLLPHGLGHSLGIQTHDVGCRNIQPEPRNPFLRNTSTIVAEQVFTIEPGCYFIDSLLAELRAEPIAASLDWTLIDALVPFGGVRIEDDVRVTATGHENMTRAFLSDAAIAAAPTSGAA
jgi:Xaa-Pro dipeptidase